MGSDDQNPNVEYAAINHNETSKKNHGVESNQIEKNEECICNPNCPVSSLKIYLSNLSQEEEYFQIPRKSQRELFCQMDTWYKRKWAKTI